MASSFPTVLITGATSGLGRYLATVLYSMGWNIQAHGRDQRKLDELEQSLISGEGQGAVTCFQADLSAISQIRRMAAEVLGTCGRLDVLVNNAGVGFGAPGDSREVSQDGHELRLAVNYLAPYLLSDLLRPLLVRSAPARIVNVGSLGQAPVDLADPEFAQDYDGTAAYRRSKLALVCHTFDLAADLSSAGVTVNCLHPATFMATAMVLDSGVTPRSTLEEGGEAALRLITGESSAGRTGQFFDGLKLATAIDQAYDCGYRRALREVTSELIDGGPPQNAPVRG